MADEFLRLNSADQREIINAAAAELKILPAVAEKDVWVCFVLNVLFSIRDRRPMVFKGGNGWDAKDITAGVYYYIITIKDEKKKGFVTVVK